LQSAGDLPILNIIFPMKTRSEAEQAAILVVKILGTESEKVAAISCYIYFSWPLFILLFLFVIENPKVRLPL
jgi:hypothetical protein